MRKPIYGKIDHKTCYTCSKPATTVYHEKPMCLRCATFAVKSAALIESAARRQIGARTCC